MNNWIDVNDKLPEDGQDVITLSEGRVLNHAVYDTEKAVFRYGILIINPTHWIPLPPMPEPTVKHGEWVERAYGRKQCTCCGKCEDVATDICPNCNAIMSNPEAIKG